MKNGMKKLLAAVLLTAMLLSVVAIETTALAAYKVKYIKTTGKCNIRISPKKDAKKIGTAGKGKVYAYDCTKKDKRGVLWYGIIYGSYGTGWISSKNAKKYDPDHPTKKPTKKPTAKPTKKPTAKPIDYNKFEAAEGVYMVVGKTVNMRTEPSTEASVIGRYSNGSLLDAVKTDGNWMELKDGETGRVGYISCKYLQEYVEPEPEVVEAEDTLEVEETAVEDVTSGVVDNFDELKLAVPNVALIDAPEGSSDVIYAWLDVEELETPIAQISFKYQGIDYVLRAALSDTVEAAADIDGVTLEEEEHDEASEEALHIEKSEDGQTAVAHFYDEAAATQYTLTGPAAADGAVVEEMANVLFAK